MRTVKNIVIVRNAYSWQYGGAEQFAYNLGRVLRDAGIAPTVVSRVPELLKHCERDNIRTFKNLWLKNETHRSWMLLYCLLFPILIGQYIWVLIRSRADILIVSSRDDQVFGTIAAKFVGVPVIWFDHADMKHIVASRFRFLSHPYYWALRTADRVIMTSQAERDKISVNLPLSKQSNFVVINNGALKGAGTPIKHPNKARIIAYAGRLDRDKGIFDLVDAAREIIRQVPKTEFWIAGKGPYEDEFKAKIKELGLSNHFKLLGHLNNVWDLLLTADIFVYPTHHDAAPLAPVEAILAGVPVVASNIGGIPEMVPSAAGILTPPQQPDKLAKTIIELLTDEKKLTKLREGAKLAGKELEFSTVLIKHYLPLFQKIIEERT